MQSQPPAFVSVHPLIGCWVAVSSTQPEIAELQANKLAYITKYSPDGTGKVFIVDEKLARGAEKGSVYNQIDFRWQPMGYDRISETIVDEHGMAQVTESTFHIYSGYKTSVANGHTVSSMKLADGFDIVIPTTGEKVAGVAGVVAEVAIGFARGFLGV